MLKVVQQLLSVIIHTLKVVQQLLLVLFHNSPTAAAAMITEIVLFDFTKICQEVYLPVCDLWTIRMIWPPIGGKPVMPLAGMWNIGTFFYRHVWLTISAADMVVAGISALLTIFMLVRISRKKVHGSDGGIS
jgi:hypothetical protein